MTARRSFLAVPAILLLVGAALLAYGLTQPVSARSALADALRASSDVHSAHVIVEMQGTAPIPYTIRQEGDIQFPDRMHMVMEAGGERMEYIMIGSDYYFRDPATGRWQKQAVPTPGAGFTRFQGVDFSGLNFDPRDLAQQSKGWGKVERLPNEVVDGVPCQHYRVSFNLADMAKSMASQDNGDNEYMSLMKARAGEIQMESEYWVGEVDGRVRQMRMHIIMPGDLAKRLAALTARSGNIPDIIFPPKMETTITMRFSDYNKPVHIEAPVSGEGGGN